MFLPMLLVKDMAQVYEYNSEKNEFKVMYSFEMHDFLAPYSQLNKNFKQIDYLMLAEGSLCFLLIPRLLCFHYKKHGK